jgi:microcystin-dependent protein
MSDPYIGEIRMFGGNFAPVGWMFCDGQLVPISENDALFTVIGTTYGGDGQETFGLPDLRGRVPLHQGGGFVIGQNGGVENVTLTVQQLPSHTHTPQASGNAGTSNTPGPGLVLASEGPSGTTSPMAYLPPGGSPQQTMNPAAIGATGQNQPHGNIQPSTGVNYIISMFGIFPPPS